MGGLWTFWLWYRGKIHTDEEFRRVIAERDEWKAAALTDRKRADEVTEAGSVQTKLLQAVVELAHGARDDPRPTAKDVAS